MIGYTGTDALLPCPPRTGSRRNPDRRLPRGQPSAVGVESESLDPGVSVASPILPRVELVAAIDPNGSDSL